MAWTKVLTEAHYLVLSILIHFECSHMSLNNGNISWENVSLGNLATEWISQNIPAQPKAAPVSLSDITSWAHHHICNPGLTKQSLCSSWPYCETPVGRCKRNQFIMRDGFAIAHFLCIIHYSRGSWLGFLLCKEHLAVLRNIFGLNLLRVQSSTLQGRPGMLGHVLWYQGYLHHQQLPDKKRQQCSPG